jgi:hypothetical protein
MIFIYYFISLSRRRGAYDRYAFLLAEVAGTILWAISVALVARWVAIIRIATSHGSSAPPAGFRRPASATGGPPPGYGPDAAQSQPHSMSKTRNAGTGFAAAAAALAGLELCVNLICFCWMSVLTQLAVSSSQSRY